MMKQTTKISYRRAFPADIDIMTDLLFLLYDGEGLGLSREELLMENEQLFADINQVFFLAFADERPVGVSHGSLRREYVNGANDGLKGYLEAIYVLPEYRKNKIAAELVKIAECWAVRNGCREMASDCLLDNTGSYQFHLKIGYKETERNIFFLKTLKPQDYETCSEMTGKPMIRLATERLVIRDPLSTDIDGWHRLLSDAETMYYLPDIMTHSLEESLQNLEAAVSDTQNPDRTKYFFAIEDKATGAFIGSAGYTVTQVTPVGKIVHAGYFIFPEYRGHGYMTEALWEVFRFAFEEDGVYRIETGCLSENRASERVMQKCGMIKEAERKAAVWHDEQMKDRVEYRLLRDEFEHVERNSNCKGAK